MYILFGCVALFLLGYLMGAMQQALRNLEVVKLLLAKYSNMAPVEADKFIVELLEKIIKIN